MLINDIMYEVINSDIFTDRGQISIRNNNSVHGIFRATYTIMNKLSKKGNSKGVFIMPDLDNFFIFFGIFTTLNFIIDQQSRSHFDVTKMKINAKYKFFKNVFIYRGIRTEKRMKKLLAEFSDETYHLPIEAIPEQIVQVEDNTPLTKLKQLFDDFDFSNQIAKNQTNDYNLSDILYKSLGNINESILIIASINKTKDYLSNTIIDNKGIYELIKIGQIDKNGQIVNLSNKNVVGNYSLLICSNMDFVKNTVNEGYKFNKILIDFDNFREFVQNDVLDFLHKNEIDVFIFKSFKDYKNDTFFINNNYIKWNWSNDYIHQSMHKDRNQFHIMNQIIRNQINKSYNIKTIDLGNLTEIVKSIFSLNKIIEEMNSTVFKFYETLYEISIYYFRISFFVNDEKLEKDKEAIINLSKHIDKIKAFLDPLSYQTMVYIHHNLYSYLFSGILNNKMNAIVDIAHTLENRVAIITNDQQDNENLRAYFSTKVLSHNSINICTPNEYFKYNRYNYDHVVITSWFGYNIMQKILFSNTTANYTLLLTDLENGWFVSRLEYLNYVLNKHDNNLILKTIGYNVDAPLKASLTEEIIEKEDVFDEFEFKASNKHYSRYSDYKHNSEQEEVYPIRFSGKYIMFITREWELCIMTDIFNGQSGIIEMKNYKKISINDVVMYRESNPYLIRSIADRDETVFELRKTANIWKNLIKQCLELNLKKISRDRFQKSFIKVLKDHGCKKHSATIRNWINNDNIIIPDNIEDIRIILKLFKRDERLAEDIYKAGIEVRGAHVQAGKYLSLKTQKNIKDLYDKYDLNVNDLPYEVNDDEFGKLYYLRIERIDSPRLVNRKYIGRLIKYDKEFHNVN